MAKCNLARKIPRTPLNYLSMKVICIEDEAFYALLDELFNRLNGKNVFNQDKWIPSREAMLKLGITSKTTLQKLRDKGVIRFSRPQKKIILYDLESIYEYLEKHSNSLF
jgi:hypothetical protein